MHFVASVTRSWLFLSVSGFDGVAERLVCVSFSVLEVHIFLCCSVPDGDERIFPMDSGFQQRVL